MYAICALALVVGNLGLFAAAVKAGPDCKYDKYDFSSLKGKSFAVVDGGYTYDLTVCGTSQTKCSDKVPSAGMAVQKLNGISMECYVLGVYDTSVRWSAGVPTGASLLSSNGENCNFAPRDLDIEFTCDPNKAVPSNSDITIANDGCEYIFTFPTCHACDKGCPGGDKPGGGDQPGGNNGNGFFGTFFIVFIIVFSVYCVGGVTFNVYKKEKKGLEAIPNRDFWGALPGYTKDGIVYSTTTVYSFAKSKMGDGNGSSSTNYQNAEDQKLSSGNNGYQDNGNLAPDAPASQL